MKKICDRCNKPKNLDQFGNDKSRSDGKYPYCIECRKAYYRDYRENNPEYKLRDTEASRVWRNENQDLVRAQRKRHIEKHFQANKSRNRFRQAIYAGKVVRGSCEICGATENIEGHHYMGYEPEYAFTVKWLCATHHALYHLLERNNQEAAKSSRKIKPHKEVKLVALSSLKRGRLTMKVSRVIRFSTRDKDENGQTKTNRSDLERRNLR